MLSGLTLNFLDSRMTTTMIEPSTTDTILAVTILAEESRSTWSSGHSPVFTKFIPRAKNDATSPHTMACNYKKRNLINFYKNYGNYIIGMVDA